MFASSNHSREWRISQPRSKRRLREGDDGVFSGIVQDRAGSASASTRSASGQAHDGHVQRSSASSRTASSLEAHVRRVSTAPHFVH
jgi:hypothetical protein